MVKRLFVLLYLFKESVMNVIKVAAALVLLVAVVGIVVTGFSVGTGLIIIASLWALLFTGSFSQFGIH
jgi:hypothetical protein